MYLSHGVGQPLLAMEELCPSPLMSWGHPQCWEEANARLCFGKYFGNWGAFLLNREAWS